MRVSLAVAAVILVVICTASADPRPDPNPEPDPLPAPNPAPSPWDKSRGKSCGGQNIPGTPQKQKTPERKSPLPCRKGFVPVKSKCYKLVKEKVDWQSAALYCGAQGARLARYDSHVDKSLKTFLRSLMREEKGPVVTWVGGNTQVLPFGVRKNQAPFQVDPPRMVNQKELEGKTGCFFATLNINGKLVLRPMENCQKKLRFICGYDNTVTYDYNPYDYLIVDGNLTYAEALVKCNDINRPVASIVTAEQQVAVAKLVKKFKNDVWISATYDAANMAFRWEDKSYVVYSNWQDGVPRQSKAWLEHHCSAVDHYSGKWETYKCESQLAALCGPPKTKKPYFFTPYYPVDGFHCVKTLKENLRRLNKKQYVCDSPTLMECTAKTKDGTDWVTNSNQKFHTLKCTKNDISCKQGGELDCSTFLVRFFCPQEKDQCKALKELNVSPCSGGQVCSPAPNHFVCRCPPGFMYSESSQKCVKFCGECNAWGDPHYDTLSGKRYDFMGTCKYKFNGVCDKDAFGKKPNYDIFTTNVKCANLLRKGGTCLDTVEVNLRNIPIRYPCGYVDKKNYVFKVHVNGQVYQLNSKNVTDQVTYKEGVYKAVIRPNYFSLVVYPLDLTVLLNGRHLRVRVPDKFKGQMCGLCGDCGTDNFKLRDGTKVKVPHENGKYSTKSIVPVALNWMEKSDIFKKEECGVSDFEDKCSLEQKKTVAGANYCGIFKQKSGPLQQCFDIAKLDRSEFFIDCVYDLCEMKDPSKAVCGVLQAFAQQCLAKGVPVNWRRPDFCPMKCPRGMVYRADASDQRLCGEVPNKHGSSNEESAEGCVCKDGLYRLGNQCVPKCQCGCKVLDPRGAFVKMLLPNQWTLLPGCRETVTCTRGIDGNLKLKHANFKIPPNAVCTDEMPPKISCARGFKLGADGKTCITKIGKCKAGFANRSGWCLQFLHKNEKVPWKDAVAKCRSKGGSLPYVDTVEKTAALKEIMENRKWDNVYVAGRVKARNSDGVVSFKPAGNSTAEDDISSLFHASYIEKIRLASDIPASFIGKQGREMSVMAQIVNGKVTFKAVTSCWPLHFFCEQSEYS